MPTSPVRAVLVAALSAALAVLLTAPPAAAGGRPFTTDLTGAAEAPGPGDPDGSGTAHVRVNPGQQEVCWTIEVSDIAPVAAAHIHAAPAGAPGPVVVPLLPFSAGCVDVDRDLALAIIRDPAAYYVNVHTGDFPAGALRGQLAR